LPQALCQVLARRGVTGENAADFLEPSLKNLMPDPRSMKDMEKAAARLLQALQSRERIAIFADYDVDGGASAALLLTWLKQFDLR
ncbi:MAG TPA: single-stranded-DNA-specific exonuclease RecJ, partial [Rhodobacteraceae bacterium]|nr:single-stranded-DNA-specific exonuclease RecJ [Paracoccaceae bacterium]